MAATTPKAWKQLPPSALANGSTRVQLAEGVIRTLASTSVTTLLQNGKGCDISTGNAAVPVLIASAGPFNGKDCTINGGQTLFITVMMLVIIDGDDPSTMVQGAHAWTASMTIDGVAVRDLDGDGIYALETSTMSLPVVTKNFFGLDPSKLHRFFGVFPAVLIQDLAKGQHAVSVRTVTAGKTVNTLTETITVS